MLIDFEDIKHKLNNSKWYGTQAWYEILDIIGDCDDKGRQEGGWDHYTDDKFDYVECSECHYGDEGELLYGYPQKMGWKYCPRCGAYMRGENINE